MRDELEQWLGLAARLPPTSNLDLAALSSETRESLAHHLSEFGEALNDCLPILRSILTKIPSSDDFESVLVELEIEFQHANYHFRHVVNLLRSHDMWMDDDVTLED